jgi:hypothetical protein
LRGVHRRILQAVRAFEREQRAGFKGKAFNGKPRRMDFLSKEWLPNVSVRTPQSREWDRVVGAGRSKYRGVTLRYGEVKVEYAVLV